MEKLLTILIILVMVIVGCGIIHGRSVRQRAPLPKYTLIQLEAPSAQPQAPDNAELQITESITQPVTVNVTLLPVEDNREQAAQVIWRVTFAVALGLVLCFLVAATLISLSIK